MAEVLDRRETDEKQDGHQTRPAEEIPADAVTDAQTRDAAVQRERQPRLSVRV
jgi:hypothetical protein